MRKPGRRTVRLGVLAGMLTGALVTTLAVPASAAPGAAGPGRPAPAPLRPGGPEAAPDRYIVVLADPPAGTDRATRTVNGTNRRKLALLNLADGSVVTSFPNL
ncbi:hypothetical protein, partial [Micromonospora harpali]